VRYQASSRLVSGAPVRFLPADLLVRVAMIRPLSDTRAARLAQRLGITQFTHAAKGGLPRTGMHPGTQRSLHTSRAGGILARMRYSRLIRRFAGLSLRRPSLLLPLLGAAWRFRARGWYSRPPFLPLPPADYVKWRLYTAYGDEDAMPAATDLARYLAWSRSAGRSSDGSPGT
jgi:hypothetical protein